MWRAASPKRRVRDKNLASRRRGLMSVPWSQVSPHWPVVVNLLAAAWLGPARGDVGNPDALGHPVPDRRTRGLNRAGFGSARCWAEVEQGVERRSGAHPVLVLSQSNSVGGYGLVRTSASAWPGPRLAKPGAISVAHLSVCLCH